VSRGVRLHILHCEIYLAVYEVRSRGIVRSIILRALVVRLVLLIPPLICRTAPMGFSEESFRPVLELLT